MAFSPDEIRANRDYFAAKLRAERQLADIKRRVNGELEAELILLDTRSREAFAAGHIPGAWCAPSTELKQLMPNLPKDKELVVYCSSAH
jgi:rhodanese-related sulfurtransferase